ncbi:MAG: YebC/PmpR family DNA-binding transcriptional regulator [bacterium]|nr:YebC/PmpR family DNA-binding transcriptional regulator [bacterium]
MEEAELSLMELPIKDIEVEEDNLVLTCEKSNFSLIQKKLKEQQFHAIE